MEVGLSDKDKKADKEEKSKLSTKKIILIGLVLLSMYLAFSELKMFQNMRGWTCANLHIVCTNLGANLRLDTLTDEQLTTIFRRNGPAE